MSAHPLRVLFVLKSLKRLAYFQSTLELLAVRGHDVRLLLEERVEAPAEEAWLARMLERPNVACDVREDLRRDAWHRRAVTLHSALGYVNALRPAFAGRPRYVRRALRRSPPSLVRRLVQLPLVRTQRGLQLLYRGLAALERALPPPAQLAEYLERLSPDVIALGDFGTRGSLNAAFVRAARAQGIPVASCIASWDNLTIRPRMTAIPHRLVVWNETQRREAVELHGVPSDRVAVTGAPNFDQWFDWKPRPRGDFLGRVGLDPEKPLVLWVGGALPPWERPEADLAARWIDAIRGAEPALRDVAILVRPHPLEAERWRAFDLVQRPGVAVWPPPEDLAMPVAAAQKADYFDSIYHSSAVVGVNTTAMIEAAIVGRPVLSILAPEHHDSQLGSVHYSYLLDGGVVRTATTLEEHVTQLARVLHDGDALGGDRSFVAEFVRPHGLDRPATPFVVDALEELAAAQVEPEPDPRWVMALRVAIRLALPDDAARVKQARRALKRARRLGRRTRRLLAALPLAARSGDGRARG